MFLKNIALASMAAFTSVTMAASSTSSSADSTSSGSSTASSSTTLPSIEIVGNKFFYSNNGSQFYIKGVAYQADSANSTSETFVDPLADYSTCSRDIPYLQELGTNTIRVYAVNASLDHSKCMNALEKAGIYVIADLSQPSQSINRDSPAWTLDLYDRYTSVIDMFHGYSNVIGFFAGNEVTNNNTNTDASAFVKAAIRDSKAYMKKKNYRAIPVGYSSNDDSDTRVPMADYFACGDSDSAADFYGINMYEWCGSSSYKSSGYQSRTDEFKNLTIPIFFSEYGCNEVTPRKFQEVGTLYGSDMDDVWSGGIVYMYFEEENNYGLVSVSGTKVKTLSDFNNLKTQLASISPSTAKSSDVTTSSGTFACPATGSDWSAATSLPPTPDNDTCECLYQSLSCVIDSDVDEDDYADLYSYICNEISCSDISANGTSGKYGDYSFCSAKAKLSYVMNKYYKKNGGKSSDCSFGGSASLKSATSGSSCSSALSAASSGSSSSSDSESSGSASSSSSKSSSSSSSKSSASVLKSSIKFTVSEIALTTLLGASFIGGVSFVLF